MLLGYLRIAKADGSQSLKLQRDALLAVGVAPNHIYADLASGRHDARPGLEACLHALRPEDTLVVWKLDRLGRNLRHLVSLVETLHQRKVGLKVATGQGAQIDTATAAGRLVFGIFAALAEFEAELIRERTRAGLAAGRPAAQNDKSRAAHGHGRHGGAGSKCDRSGAAPGYCVHHTLPLSQWRWLSQSAGPDASQSGRWGITRHT
jgi:DNA invertase Pin-like site-specific DNA recombinase